MTGPKRKRKGRRRVCVIGLDGVPHGLILDLARRGVMSTMARLMESGHLHRMRASLPEISAVSWTDFMTGADAGTHGVFGFTDLKPRSYDIRFPNFADVKAPTIWDTLGAEGRTSIVINQPSTYPARPLEGTLISGFVALELSRAVWPLSRLAVLEKMGYQIDVDVQRARESPETLWQELDKTMAGWQKALNHFWDEDWDYFEFVITGTDRLHHFLWKAYEEPGHPWHQAFLDFYRQVDRLIGKILASYQKISSGLDGLFLLSDHGFCGAVQEVRLNSWLAENGFLKFTKPEPESLADVSPRAKAFALDPNRIYLHLKSRFPHGSVARADRRSLLEDISAGLRELRHDGRKVVREVFLGEEIYHGSFVARGPDLVVVGEPGFDMKGSLKKGSVFAKPSLQGMHTWDDAFFWAGQEHGDGLAIKDLAAIILGSFR